MRIALIGGLDRAEPTFSRMASALGHELICHTGKMTRQNARSLETLVERSDLVVVLTDINSHGALLLVRRRLRELGRTPVLLRNCGVARFAQLLEALESRAGTLAAAR